MDDYTPDSTDYSALLDAADSVVGPRKKRPASDPRVQSILTKMRGGESKQESTDQTDAVNPDSGASGEFQVMPYNIPKWTAKHYGKQLTPEEFRNNSDAQNAVFNGEMGGYVRKALARSGGDETKAMRMAAAAWYGGEGAMNRYDDPTPQYYKGKPYPSFREYTSKVVTKSKAGQQFDYSDLLKQANDIVGGATQAEPDYQSLLKQASDIAGPDKAPVGIPIAQPPKEPTQVLQTPAGVIPNRVAPTITPPTQTPVPETPDTIAAQATSMLDANSPRSAVLMTPGEKLPLLGNSSGLATVNLPEGTLIVNPKKLGIKAKDVPAYVKQNGFAKLIGKVDDVSDTTQGSALVTKDANGNELSSSIVTNPESAAKQAQVDKAQFPQAVTQEVKPAQAVVADRVNAHQAQPAAPISTENSTTVSGQTQPGAYGEAKVSDDEEAVPPTPEEAAKIQANQPIVFPHTFSKDQQVTDDSVLGVGPYDPRISPEENLKKNAKVILNHYAPVSDAQIDKWIADSKAAGKPVTVGDPNAKQLQIKARMLAQIIGPDEAKRVLTEQLRTDTAQNRVEAPQLPLPATVTQEDADKLGPGPLSPEDINDKFDTSSGSDLIDTLNTPVKFLTRNLLAGAMGGAGHTANYLSGVLNTIEDLNPQRGDSMREATDPYGFQETNDALKAKGQPELSREQYLALRGLPPETKSFLRQGGDFFTGVGRASQDFQSRVGSDSLLGKGVQLIGNMTSDLPRMMLLPGGGIVNFAVDSAAQTRGQGGSTKDVFKALGQGAALGGLTEFVAPFVASAADTGVATLLNKSANPLFKKGVELATVGAGVYGTSRLFGDSPEASFDNAVLMSALHLSSLLGKKAEGKGIEFHDTNGNAIRVEIKDGKVQTTDKPAEIKVAIPENQEARRATASVPTTEAEPEKTQYTSQLDEIRQNNAKTTKQVQALFPDANLSREEAADLRRQAWGEEKQDQSSEQVTGTTQETSGGTPTAEPNAAAPETTTPEKGFEITGQTGSQPTTAVGKLIEQRNVARREANTDPLTGIANRRALDRALPTAEKDPDTSVISFDANNFGQVNKQLGERAGDRVLVELGNAFKQAAEESNTGARVFRRGGDEFVMLAPKDKAEAIRDRAEQIFGERKYGDTSVSVSGSVGSNFDEANAGLQPAKAKRKGATIPPDGSQITEPAGAGNNSGEPAAPEQTGRGDGQEETGQAPAETKLPDSGQAKPDFFHDGRPAVKLERQGKRIKIQYLDGKKETPWVLEKDVTSAATDEAPKTAAVKSETIKPSQKVYTERGTEADIETRTIPRDKILTSLDEGYPAELQPRDRSRAASKDQINEISGKLNPELLGDSPKASDGRPLVVPVDVDGKTKYAVVSGNGRTEAIRKATGDAAKAYDDFVQSKGGKPGEIYAGVLDPKTDLEKFAREANESSTAKMSASEQAQADAKDLDLANFTPSDDGSIHTGANREFIKRFVGKLPASERGEMMLPDGTLSQTGLNRIRNAVFAKAYGESETGLQVIQRMAESTDNNVKRITSALLQNAPAFADLKESIDQGTRYPGLDITDDITKAVEKFSFLRENGDSVEDYLKQQGLFGEDMTPFQKRLLAVLDTHKNSGKALSGILNNYIRLANAVGDPKQISMFGGTPDENAGTLFAEAVLQYERGNELRPTNQISLLDPDQGREVQPEPGSSGPQDVSATDEGPANQAEDRESAEVSSSGSGTKQAQLKSGDTVRKAGVIGKVYDRGGELRVKFDKEGQTASEPLDDSWKSAPNPEAGSASTDLLTLGLGKTIKDDVVPGATEAAKVFSESLDDIRGAVFATGRGETARLGGGELRKNLAETARSYDIAQHALKEARNYFAKNPIEDNYDFIGHIEGGNISELPKDEQRFAKELRRLLDEARDRVRALGTGKLESFIENYFPHIWKDPTKATDVFKRILTGRRPFEGSKSFLKQRKIDTFKEGLDAGLEPISDNPVDLALLKIREMDRYVAAHKTLQYGLDNGIGKFVRIGEKSPIGSIKIDDKIGEVFLPPTMTKPEYVDTTLYEGMSKLAKDLGIKHERLTSAGPGRIGYSVQGGDRIVTQYATGERVLAHEIGHLLDHKYGFIDRFLNNPDKVTRAALKKELRTLADSKQATLDNPEGRKTSYTRKRAEQMAHILEGYANDRQNFEKKYPTVNKVFNEIIDENPELKPIRALQRSLGKTEMSTEISRGGITKAGDYYFMEPAARIINNHLSPGLGSSSAFRAWRYAGNVMNQFQLGFSAFHAMFTSLDAVTSKAALAIEQLGAGRPIEAAKSAAEVPVSWFTNLIRGDKVYKAWLDPTSTDPVHQEIARLMVEAGGRGKTDDFYHTRAATKMLDAFKRGNILGGALRLPTGAVELASRPVLEWMVPRQKMGVFADLARSEVKRLGEDATPQQIREAVQRSWDSVDNRMGQLVYDNLFWNRMVKDVAMASVRSVGWNLGSVREMGGGLKDAVTLPLRIRRALKEGKAVEPLVTHRMAYVAALPITTAIVGAMTQYLFTGKGPTELKDYFFPRTGNLDENGRPERLSLPTYIRDVYAYTRHPEKTATHKLHPLISTVAEMLENKDYYGTEIRNADDPVVQQLLDEAKYLGKNVTPFAVQGLMKERERKGSAATKILPFFGFTPAPKDVNSTKAEDLLSEIQAQHREVGSRTKAEAERSQLLSDLVREKKLGQDYRTYMRKAIEAGILKRSDIELVKKRAASDYLSYGVKKLPLDDALKVYEASDDQERAKLRTIMKLKAMHAAEKGGLNKELKQTLRSFGLLRQREPATDEITNQ